MAVKMKGIFKGLRIISQMFAQKEHEMEIGFPTDVKHVAHIGLGTSDASPSWMNEFKSIEDMSAGTLSTGGSQGRLLGPLQTSSQQDPCCPPRSISQTNKVKRPLPAPKRPKESKEEEDQNIIPYLLCKIIFLEVESIVCDGVR